MGAGKVCPLTQTNSVLCSTTDLLRLGVQKSQDVGLYKTKSHSVIFSIPKVSNVITFSWSGRKLFFINKVYPLKCLTLPPFLRRQSPLSITPQLITHAQDQTRVRVKLRRHVHPHMKEKCCLQLCSDPPLAKNNSIYTKMLPTTLQHRTVELEGREVSQNILLPRHSINPSYATADPL